jgi:hypothetical protein
MEPRKLVIALFFLAAIALCVIMLTSGTTCEWIQEVYHYLSAGY